MQNKIPYEHYLDRANIQIDLQNEMDAVKYSILHLVQSAVEKYAKGILIDVGAGKSAHKIFYKNFVEKYYSCDYLQYSDNLDFLCDAHLLPLKNECCDTIISLEVLEHLHSPSTAINEFNRILRQNGTVILTTPFFFWAHEEPFDFFRYSKYGLKVLFERKGFQIIELRPTCGVVASIGVLFTIIMIKIFRFNNRLLKMMIIINKYLQKYFFLVIDKVVDKNKRFAQGHIVIARKM